MKWSKIFQHGTTLLAALVLGLLAPAMITSQAAPLAQGNLLQNPGMELPYDNGQSPHGWAQWFQLIDKPTNASALQYALEPDFIAETNASGAHPELIHGGDASAHIGRPYDPWHGGLSQTVAVPAGSRVRFCAYNRLFASNENYGQAPSVTTFNGHAQVGIFPNGDATWDSPGIVWSQPYNPLDTWQQICSTATVGSQGKVVVFLSTDWRGSGALHLDTWWDDASLTLMSSAVAPAAQASPQPQATGPAPSTLPVAGGSDTDVATLGLIAIALGVLISFLGAGLAMSRRAH